MTLQTVKDNDISKFRRDNPLARQKRFLDDFLVNNQQRFIEAMDSVFEHDKKAYAKLYLQMQESRMPKNTDVNVNIGMSKDMEDMMMLGRAGGSTKLIETQAKELPIYEEEHGTAIKARETLPPPPEG